MNELPTSISKKITAFALNLGDSHDNNRETSATELLDRCGGVLKSSCDIFSLKTTFTNLGTRIDHEFMLISNDVKNTEHLLVWLMGYLTKAEDCLCLDMELPKKLE